jgi:hypothetical protein
MIRFARLALVALLALACSDVTTELVDARAPAATDAAPSPTIDASTTDAATTDSGGEPDMTCGDHLCACNDELDQDGDQLVDGLDPECTGWFDDDEASFATGLPESVPPYCQDCYWDSNKTSNDDGCVYHDNCLSGEEPSGGRACSSCEVTEQCVSSCKDLTQNGCDCFGCCGLHKPNGDVVEIVLSPGCSTAHLDDPERCPPCRINTECHNPCGRCELCPGMKRSDLPRDCPLRGDEPGNVCEEGEDVCSEDEPCPADFYCLYGCCQYIPQ